MRKNNLLFLFLIGAWLLAACAAPVPVETPAATQVESTATRVPATATTEPSPTNTATQAATATVAETSTSAPVSEVSFAGDLLPLLTKSCLKCHGGEKMEEGLSVKTFDTLMAGSENGAVIVAGDAENSFIVEAVRSGDMPKRGTAWTPEQVQILVDWINQGALNN